MKARGISRQDVRSTVIEPTIEMPGKNPGTKRVRKSISKSKTLEVIYKPKKSIILIVTAWWRSE
jgi:hypothetical protein